MKESLSFRSVRQRLHYLLAVEQACMWITFLACLWWGEESSSCQLKFISICKRKMFTGALLLYCVINLA